MGLQNLKHQLKEELKLLDYPPAPWLQSAHPGVLDVAIIGAGMAGLSSAFGLMQNGIHNYQVFEAGKAGLAGPWGTYARMRTLRSGKRIAGPAMGIPKLTFQSWYIAQHGENAWEALYKIPTYMWMDYLNWYKEVLEISVKYETKVTSIEPEGNFIKISFQGHKPVFANKVILATGRNGFGGALTPKFMQKIPKSFYTHTNESIDFAAVNKKIVCIIGVGSSAFDAAAVALENGASQVTLMSRREVIPFINKIAGATYQGFGIGFSELPDEAKIKFMQNAFISGSLPPFESLDRVKDFPGFKVKLGLQIKHIDHDTCLHIHTDQGVHDCDFLILGTGFDINLHKQPELSAIAQDILMWKDRHPEIEHPFGEYPYLGEHYEFLEKVPGKAPYLRNFYCFNQAAFLSHGMTSGDIPYISEGAQQLTKGITKDFFTQDWQAYYDRFEKYAVKEFVAEDYPFLQ